MPKNPFVSLGIIFGISFFLFFVLLAGFSIDFWKRQPFFYPIEAAETYLLSVNKTADIGKVTSSPAGINCGTDCVEWYPKNTTVNLNAFTGSGVIFNGWSGDCAFVKAQTCTITMDSSKNVAASFTSRTYQLSLSNKGIGFGRITSSPGGINCGFVVPAGCSASFDYNTTVTLTAKASVGSTFDGWSGACDGRSSTCTVAMTEEKTVRANFNLNPGTYPIVLVKDRTLYGNGTVSSSPSGINCGPDCLNDAASFPYNTRVTLRASPDKDSDFSAWAGSCSGSSTTCVLSASQPRDVQAVFITKKLPVIVAKSGRGSGTITSQPTGINCGENCSWYYPKGAEITLRTIPSPGSYFHGWQVGPEACQYQSGPCIFTMNKSESLNAVFDLNYYTLSAFPAGTGAGAVTSNPGRIICRSNNSGGGNICSQAYEYGTMVTLTAQAMTGSEFNGWTGACAAKNTTTCDLTINQDASAVAIFNLKTYTLTVTKTGTGLGTITSTFSPQINCGVICSGSYNYERKITFTAVPSPGSYFSGWPGTCAGTSPTCSVSMTEDKNVNAEFTVFTLGVDLTAQSQSGYAPFATDISAAVSGTAPGTINYTFWWDCDYPGTSVADTIKACRDPDNTAGNAIGIKFNGINHNPKTISHTYAAIGTYSTKVIVERNILAAEKRTTITANGHQPSAKKLDWQKPDYCLVGPSAVLSWQFDDPKSGDRQTAYRVQVDNDSSFSSPKLDSGKTLSSSEIYSTPRGILNYNNTYYWRVKVWDSLNDESLWLVGPAFTTPVHQYPRIDFAWLPLSPAVSEDTTFIDSSTVYGGAKIGKWQWKFTNGRPETSNQQNPSVFFRSLGAKTVTLTVTDSDNFSCFGTRSVNVQAPLPE